MTEFMYFNEIIRFSIGIVLLVAAYSKTIGFQQFMETLASSFHFNNSLSLAFAPLLIAVEYALGITLIAVPEISYWAVSATLIMFVSFTLVLAFMLFRDGVVKCNCFGAEDRPVSIADIARNLICILAMGLYLFSANSTTIQPIESQVLLFVIATSIAFILVNFHQVISVLTKSE